MMNLKKPSPRVYLAGEGALWRAQLLDGYSLPWGHRHEDRMERADAVFLWMWENPPGPRVGYDLGVATALAKPILVAASGHTAERLLRDALEEDFRFDPVHVHHDVKSAYETVMADIDVRLPQVYKKEKARISRGLCKGCSTCIQQGSLARVSKYHAYHEDCYLRTHDPDTVHAAIFTEEMVSALRAENTQLEQRLKSRT